MINVKINSNYYNLLLKMKNNKIIDHINIKNFSNKLKKY